MKPNKYSNAEVALLEWLKCETSISCVFRKHVWYDCFFLFLRISLKITSG